MTPTSHHTPECKCLGCGRPIDAATGVSDQRKPDPGDITVCLYCGHVMAFTDDLTLRELNDAEIIELAGNPTIVRLQKVRAKVMADQAAKKSQQP